MRGRYPAGAEVVLQTSCSQQARRRLQVLEKLNLFSSVTGRQRSARLVDR
jgi:hypothetical protein